jgi:hypothetical protein
MALNRVNDYHAWRKTYDSKADFRQAAGITRSAPSRKGQSDRVGESAGAGKTMTVTTLCLAANEPELLLPASDRRGRVFGFGGASTPGAHARAIG